MLRKVLTLTASAGVIAACAAAGSFAQSEEPAAERPASDDVITVTARKREENVQDVPVTISSFDREQIEDFSVSSLEDISNLITGVQFIGDQGNPLQTEIIIRGGGVARQLNVDGGTGLYFNGINIQGGNLGGRSLGGIDTFDMQRIEVLKGPQGALYGRNALGGTINVISRRPNLESSAGELRVTIADNRGVGVDGGVDLVLAPGRAAVRLAGRHYEQSEGFYFNPFLDTFMDSREESFLRAVGLFQLTPEWQMVLQADYSEVEREGNTVFPSNIVADPFNWAQDDLNRASREERNYYAAISGELGWGRLDLIANYRKRSGTRFVDDDSGIAASPFDATAQVPCTPAMMGAFAPNQRCFTTTEGDYEKLSVEARLSGQTGNLNWIAGVDAFEASDIFAQQAEGRGVNSFDLDLSNDVRSWSAFGGGEFALSDRLSIGVEGRHTQERKDLLSLVDLTFGPVAGTTVISEGTVLDSSYFTWAAFATYEFTDWLRGFVRAGSGFRTGGLNTDARDNVNPNTGLVVEVPDFYDEERAVSYELGFKSEPRDGLVLNGTVYFIEYQDFISNANNGLAGLDRVSYVTNLGDAELFGAELELAGRARVERGARRRDGLQLNWSLGVSYNSGEITNAINPADQGLGISRVPEWSWRANIRASMPAFANARAFVAAEYSGQSGGFQTFANNVDLPDPHVVNLNAGLNSPDWRLQLTVRNLLEEDELVRNPSGPTALTMNRAPRTWSMSVTRRFGG
jgi:iron complex outermembrane receptor protein